MAKTLAQGAKKWNDVMPEKGDDWKRGVTDKKDDYREGFGGYIGPGAAESDWVKGRAEQWSDGVGRVSASEYNDKVRGKGLKYANSLRRKAGLREVSSLEELGRR